MSIETLYRNFKILTIMVGGGFSILLAPIKKAMLMLASISLISCTAKMNRDSLSDLVLCDESKPYCISWFSNSTITLSTSSVQSSSSITATLTAINVEGGTTTRKNVEVKFSNSDGTSTGTWSPTVDNGNGTYSATFTGIKSGTPTTISAKIFDHDIYTKLPTVSVIPGPPKKLTLTSGNDQSAAHLSTLLLPFSVTIVDANENLVPNSPVDWLVTSGGGSISESSSYTDTDGLTSSTLTLGLNPGANTVTATSHVNTSLTTTFTATATISALSASWNMNSSSDYTFGASIETSGGVCRLVSVDQTDNDNTTKGFAGGTYYGVNYGTLAGEPTSSGLKLSNNGGCNGATTDCAISVTPEIYELNSTWTPQYSNLVWYEKLNGTVGNLANNTAVAATIGTNNATAHSGTATGLKYASAKLKQGITFDGNSTSYLDVPSSASLQFNTSQAFTLSAWVNRGTNDTNGNLISKVNLTTQEYLLGFATSSTLNCGVLKNSAIYIGQSAPAPSKNAWHHIACTWNGGWTSASISIYIDGIKAASSAYESFPASFDGISAGSATLGIGQVLPGAILNAFNGSMDEIAIWKSALDASEIKTIYQTQAVKKSGVFTSRIIDAFNSGQLWNQLRWETTIPFLKAFAASEVSYSSNSSNELNETFLAAFWAFDENQGIYDAQAQSFADRRNNNSAVPVGGVPTFDAPGKLNRSIQLKDSIYLSVTPIGNSIDFSNTGGFTISLWAKYTSTSAAGLIYKKDAADKNGYDISIASGGQISCSMRANGAYTSNLFFNITSSLSYADGVWHQITCSYDQANTTAFLYIDGILANSVSANRDVSQNGENLYIGSKYAGASPFTGFLDEIIFFNGPLTFTAIKHLYLRGASRIKFQVRSCSTSSCSDGTWKGPDGTDGTFFSELNNVSDPVLRTANTFLPTLDLPTYTAPAPNNRYFQYRTIFESDSATSTFMPELKNVTIGPEHFDGSSPSFTTNTGVSVYSLSNFVQTIGANGCTGGVGYNVGVGSTSSNALWFWWNGSAWALADGTATQSNSAATTKAHLGTFDFKQATSKFFVKTYLKSDGLSACELDHLQITGQQ